MFKITKFGVKYITLTFFVTLFIGVLTVNAELPDAPVISSATIEIDGNSKTLIVQGSAPKETEVLIYINDGYLGSTKVLNEGEFIFLEPVTFSQEIYSVLVAARNSATQEISNLSNKVLPVEIIKIRKPVQKTPKKVVEEKIQITPKDEVVELKATDDQEEGEISTEAAQEESPVVKGHEDEYNEDDLTETQEDKESLKNLQDILSNNKEQASSTPTGIMNEAREELGKIKLNVFIFLIFLVAVIAWIVWVNRELIKEKQEDKN